MATLRNLTIAMLKPGGASNIAAQKGITPP